MACSVSVAQRAIATVNTAFAYVDPARVRPNLTILDRALCDRVVSTGAGVEAFIWRDGQEVRVVAETVVLAAGAYGSPGHLITPFAVQITVEFFQRRLAHPTDPARG